MEFNPQPALTEEPGLISADKRDREARHQSCRLMIDRKNTPMNNDKPWMFTCKTCGGHDLNVFRFWTILAGSESENWQEWGPLDADHHWHFEFKKKLEKETDAEVEQPDFAEYAKDNSSSSPKEYEIHEQRINPGTDRFYVMCAGCERGSE